MSQSPQPRGESPTDDTTSSTFLGHISTRVSKLVMARDSWSTPTSKHDMVCCDSAEYSPLRVPYGSTGYAFSSCGDGTTTIAHEDSPDKLTVVQTLKTERGAKTMTIDLKTHKIYLGAAKYEASTAGQKRPKMIPGSFKVLVYGR